MTQASEIKIACYRDGEIYNDWFDRSTNKVVTAGYGYGKCNWVVAVSFRLDSACSSLSLSLTTADAAGGYRDLNYIIIPEAEYSADSPYNNASYDMAHDGTLSVSKYSYTPVTVSIDGVRPAGRYYLYLWTARAPNDSATCYSRLTNNANGRITVSYEAIAGTASTVALMGGVLGQEVKIQITRDNAAFLHTLRWSFAGGEGLIVQNTADTLVTWTPDADALGALIPTASEGLLTVSCETYYDGQPVGEASQASLTLTLPADAAPRLEEGWAAVTHTNEGTAAEGLSVCLGGHSLAAVVFDPARVTARYGAAVEKLTARLGGAQLEGGGTLGPLAAGDNVITLTAADSRGKTSSASVTLTALPYSKPVLGGVSVYRCGSGGEEAEDGAFCCVTASVTYSDGGGQISCPLTAAIKPVGGSYGGAVTLTSGEAAVIGGTLSDTVTYTVLVQAVDSLGAAARIELTVPSAACAFHIREGGDGMGLGKYGERVGAVDVAWDMAMNGRRILGLGDPIEAGDALSLGYAQGAFAPLGGVQAGYSAMQRGVGDSIFDSALAAAADGAVFTFSVDDSGGALGLGGLWHFRLMKQGEEALLLGRGLSGGALRRFYSGGAWGEWEHFDPPMEAGVEYPTMRRHMGRRVYAKLLELGAMPNCGELAMPLCDSPVTLVGLRGICYGDSVRPLPLFEGGALAAELSFSPADGCLHLVTWADLSACTATAVAEYVKL